jgi:phosphoenolpyruvate phosphomutase
MVAGAHNVLGARLAAESGFAGIWASSFELATSHGVPDSDVLKWWQLHAAAAEIAASVPLPVVADCQSGFGGPDVVRELVMAHEEAGVAAICLEDGACPHRNSLQPGSHALAAPEEFCRKIEVAVGSRRHLLVLARLQSLIAGNGQRDAEQRAAAYVNAGADAVVVHSRSPQPDEVLRFVAAWSRPTPLVLIPTTYHEVTSAELKASGKIRMVIYANHGMRAAIAAMRRAFRQILDEGTSHQVESWIATVNEVFALQSPPLRGPGP